jgi:hypothetical protein
MVPGKRCRRAIDIMKLTGGGACKMPNSKRVVLKVGDRVKMSVLGSKRSPRLARKVDSITGVRRDSRTIFVRFDGDRRRPLYTAITSNRSRVRHKDRDRALAL